MTLESTLSPVHAMAATISRAKDAHFINRLANHKSIDRFIRGYAVGRMNFASIVDDPRNFILEGELGAITFRCHQRGIYEAHTMILPEGRGRWALYFAKACLLWMFSKTDAIEILAKTPRGNLGVLALVRSLGFVYEFDNPRGWVIDGDPVSVGIHSIHVEGWIRNATELRERGTWYYDRIEQEIDRVALTAKPTIERPADDQLRQIGAACEMLLNDQPQKAAVFYNRFAVMAGAPPLSVIGVNPVTIDVGFGLLSVRDDTFDLMSTRLVA